MLNLINAQDIYGGAGQSAPDNQTTAAEASSMDRVVNNGNTAAYTLLFCIGALVLVRVIYEMAD